MTTQWVYSFNAEKTEGDKSQKNLLGGKGANLAEMAALKLPVPPGFTITTEACLDFDRQGKKINEDIKSQVLVALKNVERLTNKKFGDQTHPLLFSVRSGARASMPGMMDTVLNLGLNEESAHGLAKATGNPRFAWDSYRRFIQMFSDVVLGVDVHVLEAQMEDLKEARGVKEDTGLTADDLHELCLAYKKTLSLEHGIQFPDNPLEQLWSAIAAVFGSWNNPRATRYRELNGLSHDWGTAVNVQAMVFGNMGDRSATGVCFTRDPSTGHKRFFGEYLINAQGEDVVAGIRNPCPINNDSKNNTNDHLKTLEEVMPKAFAELTAAYQKLEHHYKDMQDIEFTIENDILYLLQTRNGKRTTRAAIKIAVDFVNEKLISREEALMRVRPEDLNQLLHPRLDPKANKDLLTRGLPASPGAASGKIVFDSDVAHEWRAKGEKVILVRLETSPEDIHGMDASQGILTARGGMTSHAAVVARGMGKPCVAGCSALVINEKAKTLLVAGKSLKEGDYITMDGGTGEIFNGLIPTIEAEISEDFSEYMSWADSVRKLKIRTNADTPKDSIIANKFGAEGIGLCRTEHMFFDAERILAVREMIFANTKSEREKALHKLLPFQQSDFEGIFEVMKGKPVNIRLLDPPLHEFLPHKISEKEELAKVIGISVAEVENRIISLHEFNPMLGHRGCRLAITFPEIYEMQVKAIALACVSSVKKGFQVLPEIMIPLVAYREELKMLRDNLEKLFLKVLSENKVEIKYKIGTMIELPRAAIVADTIAEVADFFSFGTNDLTQTALGLSRDDAGKFLVDYQKLGLMPKDPFVTIDEEGVGYLIKLATQKGRSVKKDLSIGICGEHGGDPDSIKFCHKAGLDYVSCSPFRVPIARLAAAQAAMDREKVSYA